MPTSIARFWVQSLFAVEAHAEIYLRERGEAISINLLDVMPGSLARLLLTSYAISKRLKVIRVSIGDLTPEQISGLIFCLFVH